MIIAGIYSFNNGKQTVEQKYPQLYREVQDIIKEVDANSVKQKSVKKRLCREKCYTIQES